MAHSRGRRRDSDRTTPCPSSPLREYTIPVFFRLMLGCGQRPQEARLLRRRDVDAATAILTIQRRNGTMTAASPSTKP